MKIPRFEHTAILFPVFVISAMIAQAFLTGCSSAPPVPPERACEVATIAAATATVNSCTAAYESASTPAELVALDAFCLEATRHLVALRDEGGAKEACANEHR